MSSQSGVASGATGGTGGSGTWSNPTNAEGGGGSATCSLSVASASQQLTVFFGGFSIPTGAVIQGFVVGISRWNSGGPRCQDQSVEITVGGVSCPNNYAATGSDWPSSVASQGYGGASDLWGGTGITPANINSSGAAVGLIVTAVGTHAAVANVSSVGIEVFYLSGGVVNQAAAIFLPAGLGM